MDIAQRKRQAKILRIARKLDRTTGAILFIFFFIVACTFERTLSVGTGGADGDKEQFAE